MYATPREDWDPSIFFVKSPGKTGGSDDIFFRWDGTASWVSRCTKLRYHLDICIIYILALSFEMHFIFERYIHYKYEH